MNLTTQLDLGDLRLRTLLQDDAELLVEATRHEQARALWGPRPAGPYSLDDARTALQQWDPARGGAGLLRSVAGRAAGRCRGADARRPTQRRAGLLGTPRAAATRYRLAQRGCP